MLRGARIVRRRSLLRAAAAGGVAYRAGKHLDRNREEAAGRQAQIGGLESRAAAGPAPARPASTLPAPAPDMQAKLKMLDDLGALRERGVLSDEEFAQQKQRVLEG